MDDEGFPRKSPEILTENVVCQNSHPAIIFHCQNPLIYYFMVSIMSENIVVVKSPVYGQTDLSESCWVLGLPWGSTSVRILLGFGAPLGTYLCQNPVGFWGSPSGPTYVRIMLSFGAPLGTYLCQNPIGFWGSPGDLPLLESCWVLGLPWDLPLSESCWVLGLPWIYLCQNPVGFWGSPVSLPLSESCWVLRLPWGPTSALALPVLCFIRLYYKK